MERMDLRLRIQNGVDAARAGDIDIGDYENLLETSPTSGQLRVPVAVHRQPLGSTRSNDSGIPKDVNGDMTPRSGSISESSTSPEKGTSESSSGVHSAASFGDKRSSSMENITQIGTLQRPTWKSMSLQRTAVPPPPPEHGTRLVFLKDHQKALSSSNNNNISSNNTVVIHRKERRPKDGGLPTTAEPFGRATNIRMTSFTDHPDFSTNVVNISTSKSPPLSPHHQQDSHLSARSPLSTMEGIPSVPSHTNLHHQRRDSANYSLASSAESESSAHHS